MFELKCFYEDGTPVTHFTQWDVNQTIVIDGEYTKAPMVHFANKNSEFAICVQSILKSNGQLSVDVPNILLTEHYPIIIYIYPMTDDIGRTILSEQFQVVKRPQPNDFTFEENMHVIYITQLEDEIRELKNTMVTTIDDCKEATEKANSIIDSKVSNPLTGAVGQILEISAVNDKGMPTEYIAVDKPSVMSQQQISIAVNNYLSEHPVQSGATEEQATQITNNKNDIELIKKEISDLTYVEIEISEITNNIKISEIGSTVDSVRISWKTNKTPTSLTLDGKSIDVSTTSILLTGLGLKTNKTWKLKVTDERNYSHQRDTSLSFLNGIYYGVAAESTYDSAFVLALTKVLSNSKARTFTVNAGTGQYIYYCLPSRLGTPSFNVGGFDGGFKKMATISFTNSSGYSENYDIWKSDNANLGDTKVKVS